MFHSDIQIPRRESKTWRAVEYFFYKVQGVWIASETLSLAFDISSQSKQKLRGDQRRKIVKIYSNYSAFSKI